MLEVKAAQCHCLSKLLHTSHITLHKLPRSSTAQRRHPKHNGATLRDRNMRAVNLKGKLPRWLFKVIVMVCFKSSHVKLLCFASSLSCLLKEQFRGK